VVHKVAVSLKSHVRFMAESALNLAQRSQRLLSHYRSGAPKIQGDRYETAAGVTAISPLQNMSRHREG
jgi:hypothetical protein